jgi:bacterial/archaeal transporter family-2 protein
LTAISAVNAGRRPKSLGLPALTGGPGPATARGTEAALAVRAAANGQLVRSMGEPWASTRTIAFAVVAVVAMITLATTTLDAMPGNPLLYVGGLLGMFVVVVTATAVQTLGVVRLGLAMVAGQMAGALVVDLIAPAPGQEVTAATVAGVVLTMLAVVISGRSQRDAAARYA